MPVSIIVAAAEDNAIGKDNKLLWHLPNDLRFFKNKTWGLPAIMGRRSFKSLGNKPLNGRLNIVITRNKDFQPDGVVVVNNLKDAIFVAKEHDYKEIMILGGGEIYNIAMPLTDIIYLTRVHATFADADTFFPQIDTKDFELVSNEDHFKDEKHAYDYSFQVWKRR